MLLNTFFKSFRILLLPFAWIYWLIVAGRNFLYNKNILKSTKFSFPLINVGNLAVGGTGKSPMVEYIAALLKQQYKVATLSRGYKRRTKGYVLAGENITALEIGDEPMQFYTKFKDVAVAVGEARVEAIPQLLHDRPDTDVIILDDAFQHRAITAGYNILLTDYSNLFTRDFYLPTGDLRDIKSRYKAAQVIVVTKCPADLSELQAQKINKEIRPYSGQSVYFATLGYNICYHIFSKQPLVLNEAQEVIMVTGIANPAPLKKYVAANTKAFHLLQYADHHIFSIDDIKEIVKKYEGIEQVQKLILTTEKDAVRLMKYEKEYSYLPIYVIPVKHVFLYNGQQRFDEQLLNFIIENKKNGA